jgi:hypothetical protein
MHGCSGKEHDPWNGARRNRGKNGSFLEVGSRLNLQAPSLTGENSLGQYFQPWGFSKRGKKKREEMLYVVSTRV